MPIYEYECAKHGRFEVNQRITEAALSTCTIEACGEPVRKLISTTSFALKGSGWYVTDYGKGNSSPPAGGGAKAEAKSDAGACGADACGAGAGACAAPTAQA